MGMATLVGVTASTARVLITYLIGLFGCTIKHALARRQPVNSRCKRLKLRHYSVSFELYLMTVFEY
jgi:hypothetical protein